MRKQLLAILVRIVLMAAVFIVATMSTGLGQTQGGTGKTAQGTFGYLNYP